MKKDFSKIPSVNSIIENCPDSILRFGKKTFKQITDEVIAETKNNNQSIPTFDEIIKVIKNKLNKLTKSNLQKVINATGKVLHTNLGRSPLGSYIFNKLKENTKNYCNIEFDLITGKRGHRDNILKQKLKMLCNCEDAIIVNNNAAALFLILNTFAKNKQTIISRSELIEIGGSFRIPDIMQSSETIMKEIGTTNKTHLSDYENAITENTGLLIKVHQSNYFIGGFTTEVSLEELAKLAKKHNLPFVYDLGSGLLNKNSFDLNKEPDVLSAINAGADIICFSGDKLLGGPQAGIIVGKKEYIQKLAKSPLVRALRVGKLTYAALEAAINLYFEPNLLIEHNMVFKFINRKLDNIFELASLAKTGLQKNNIESKIIESEGFSGGGTLPNTTFKSYSLEIISKKAKTMQKALLNTTPPVVSNVIKGKLEINMFCIQKSELECLIQQIIKAYI